MTARSRLYVSPAWPDASDPPFVNAAAVLETGFDADALLAALHAIEAGFGRRRGTTKNAPRTLDLDLIDFNGKIREPTAQSALRLPHPRAAERDFVLAPVSEIAPGWRHPVLKRTVAELLADCPQRQARPLE